MEQLGEQSVNWASHARRLHSPAAIQPGVRVLKSARSSSHSFAVVYIEQPVGVGFSVANGKLTYNDQVQRLLSILRPLGDGLPTRASYAPQSLYRG